MGSHPPWGPFGSSFVSFLPFGPSFPLFWPFGLSFPFIVAFWAFIPFIFAFWWLASGVPPTSCQKRFAFPRSHIKNLTAPGRAPFSDFWPLGLHFLLFWPCGPSFLAVWLCGPSFSFILAFWAFISFHFGLVGLHFHSFWPFRGQLLAPPPQVAKNGPFAQRPYNGFISAVTGSILQFLALWAFISLHFGLVGLHFVAFWPCGPSFPCILALWAFISLHFGLVGRHFLAFWPCGPSFPFILAFSGSASGPPPTSCQKWPVCPTSLQWIYQRRDRLHFAVFGLVGLHFLYFGLLGFHFLSLWPFGPSFPLFLPFGG